MSEMITRALLITVNAAYGAVYGGETLVNRALIALSKSGVRSATIVCQAGEREKITALIHHVAHRLLLRFDIVEKRADEPLAHALVRATEQWQGAFFLFTTDAIVHPTFFTQARRYLALQKPLLFAYKQVRVQNGQVVYGPGLAEKFRVSFAHSNGLRKISLDITSRHGGSVDLAATTDVQISPTVQHGLISTDVAICRPADLVNITFDTQAELIQRWLEKQSLAVGFIENAWWLKLTGEETPAQIKQFFWGLAFKEISGEFSKLVNSKLSKPTTFLFVDLGFSPNAVSILELVLFLLSSVFLLSPHYWTMILFAVIWQFSAGVLDRCDGEVARIRNYESDAGGRFDMLIDDLRFALPFLFLTIACYREYTSRISYLLVAAVSALWYGTAVVLHSQFLRRSGYVSIQTMGQDFFKNRRGAWVNPYRRIQPLVKGDMRTFYLFLLTFLGSKHVLFWTLVVYAWLVGGSYFFTVLKFRPPRAGVPVEA